MKLLYVASTHPLQNADDCLMWERLGLDWVDTGYYSLGEQCGDLPFIPRRRPDLYERLATQRGYVHPDDAPGTLSGDKNLTWAGQTAHNQWEFTADFVGQFDVVLFNHYPENVERNLDALGGVMVVLKTYGMHGRDRERVIRGLRERYGVRVVRNNPVEGRLFGTDYAGHDAIIRGSVVRDEDELSGWTGDEEAVCTFSNYCGTDDTRDRHYSAVRHALGDKYDFRLFGVGNAFVSHAEKVSVLRSCRANLVLGTPGASNTYSFVEAWVMGQPVVAFGPRLWQSESCEVEDLLENGVTGFRSNRPEKLADYIRILMTDAALAGRISAAGRAKAVATYGRRVLAEQWKAFFERFV